MSCGVVIMGRVAGVCMFVLGKGGAGGGGVVHPARNQQHYCTDGSQYSRPPAKLKAQGHVTAGLALT